MRIRHIEVEDFLGYAKESLSLPLQGVIAICGNSGTGKSSLIVDAVGFALFGYKATRAERIEELRRQGAPGKAMRVMVAFQNEDGSSLEVERGLDDNGRTFARYRDSHDVEATSPKGVDTELRSRIGAMTWQVYYRAFVARQRELAVMTEAGGTERRQFIHRMIGIDAFDRVSQELRRKARAAEGIVRYIEEEIAAGDADPEALHAEATARLTDVAARAQSSADEAQARAAQAEALESELVPLREMRAAIATHGQTIAAADAAEPDLVEAIAEIAALEAEHAAKSALVGGEADSRRAARAAVHAERQAFDRAQAGLDERRRIDAELSERQAERDAIDLTPPNGYSGPDLERVITLIGEIESDGKYQKVERERLEENQRAVVEDGTCATCLRPTDGPERQRLEELFAAELAALEEDLQAKRTQYLELKALRDDASAHEAARVLHQQATQHAQTLDAQIGRLQARRAELAALDADGVDADALAARQAEADAAVAEIDAAERWLADHADLPARRAKQEGRLQRLRAARAEAQAFLAAHPGADDLDEREALAREAARAAADAGVQAATLVGERETLQADVSRLADRVAARAEQRSRLGAQRAEVTRARDLDELTTEFRGALASELRPQLEEMCSQVMALLSQGKHPAIRIDEDYEIALSRGDGEWLPIRLISGGEDTRANFALRLALTRLITDRTGAPFEYLILDEIFESQDDGHRERMLDVLRGVQSLYPQVFLISHVGELHQSAAVDYVIDVAEGDAPARVTLRAL